jgi:hypothetical protein
MNGPTAKVCWKCGEDLILAKQPKHDDGYQPVELPYESSEDRSSHDV